MNWATTKGTADFGAMPVNVSVSILARVTAGLAKLVEAVNLGTGDVGALAVASSWANLAREDCPAATPRLKTSLIAETIGANVVRQDL